MSTTRGPGLLDLPFELRDIILRMVLRPVQEDRIVHILKRRTENRVHEVLARCSKPLFEVCRLLRRESLAIFYETWILYWPVLTGWKLEHEERKQIWGDPLEYPRSSPPTVTNIIGPVSYHPALSIPSTSDAAFEFPSALPWLYPDVFLSARLLWIRIFLRWTPDLEAQLHAHLPRIAQALDYGRRLEEFQVFVHVDHRVTWRSSADGAEPPAPKRDWEKRSLRHLLEAMSVSWAEMRVRGWFRVLLHWHTPGGGATDEDLVMRLEQRIMNR